MKVDNRGILYQQQATALHVAASSAVCTGGYRPSGCARVRCVVVVVDGAVAATRASAAIVMYGRMRHVVTDGDTSSPFVARRSSPAGRPTHRGLHDLMAFYSRPPPAQLGRGAELLCAPFIAPGELARARGRASCRRREAVERRGGVDCAGPWPSPVRERERAEQRSRAGGGVGVGLGRC